MEQRKWYQRKPETILDWLLIIFSSITLYIFFINFGRVRAIAGQLMDILAPFAAGIAIAYIVNPVVEWAHKHLLRSRPKLRWLAMLIGYIVAVAIVVAMLYLIVTQVFKGISEFASGLPRYANELKLYLIDNESRLPDWLPAQQIIHYLSNLADLVEELLSWVMTTVLDTKENLSYEQVITGAIEQTIGSISSIFMDVFTALAASIYLLIQKKKLLRHAGILTRAFLPRRVANNVLLKEQVADFPPQPVITKDNVTMQIDTVIYFEITDPKLFTYGVERPMTAIENLSATTLRNIIGDLELDQTLTSRDVIDSRMRSILDEATDPWGIKINRVELKNILPPKEIQNAMEKQMKAERERRESILRAEGEKKSAILIAEGEKESAILRADAKKQAQILEAEGEAEAILKVQTATAEGIRRINESCPSDAVIKLRSLEAFAAAANGRATKIIIPSELQSLAGLAASMKEIIVDPPRPEKKPDVQ